MQTRTEHRHILHCFPEHKTPTSASVRTLSYRNQLLPSKGSSPVMLRKFLITDFFVVKILPIIYNFTLISEMFFLRGLSEFRMRDCKRIETLAKNWEKYTAYSQLFVCWLSCLRIILHWSSCLRIIRALIIMFADYPAQIILLADYLCADYHVCGLSCTDHPLWGLSVLWLSWWWIIRTLINLLAHYPCTIVRHQSLTSRGANSVIWRRVLEHNSQ